MAVSEFQTSFAGGELSQNLYARVDLAKFEIGAALLRNFFVDFRGGASNRPGTEYIVTAKGVCRVWGFVVSTQASYVLEIGDLYIRYIQNGAQLETSPGVAYETSTPYVIADVPLLKFAQSADVLTITHPSYPPATLTRTSDTTFSYTVLSVGPTLQPPVLTDVKATSAKTKWYGYLITAIDLDGKEESLPSNPGTDESDILDETKNQLIKLTWTAPAQPISKYNIYKWGPIEDTLTPASAWGYIGSSQTVQFVDNNIAPDFSKQPPQFSDPFSGGQFETINVNAGGAGYNASGGWSVIPYVPLVITGDGTGAAGYGIIDQTAGTIVGVYLTNPGKNYTAAVVTCDGEGGTGATFTYTFTALTPLYPACSAYFQQRRCFGGSNLKPETIIMSQTGLYTNWNTTPVSLATDAIAISLASLQVNTIKSMVPVSYGMIAFTTGSAFLINGGSPYAALTPATINAQPQASNGANDLPPLQIDYDILYVQNRGNRVRDLAFAWQRQAYTGNDISALAAHLFDGFSTVEWAWAQEPFKLVWAVRNDGVALTCTYVPDQEVFAWARHDTQGLFKSVCSIPEGNVNAVYFVVQRTVGGVNVNFIERLAKREQDSLLDAWYLDAALNLPHTFPAASIALTSLGDPGTGEVQVNATPGIWNTSQAVALGDVIQIGQGQITVNQLADSVVLFGQVTSSLDLNLPFNTAGTETSAVPGAWSIVTPATTVSGLDYLEGEDVFALADGLALGPFTVSGGEITLPDPAASLVVGLPYTQQIKTLYLTVDGLVPGTIQGKRKLIPALTCRVASTRGLQVGPSFDALTPVPDLVLSGTTDLFTGDARAVIFGTWDLYGQMYVEQPYPMPATVLGLIPEVAPGDTGR